ncbi:MAG: GNAT family N-acetyltransferase [Clostridiales bacterium]|nr:GNAT family N-acetyltransferase [Clostridiales bacterium]
MLKIYNIQEKPEFLEEIAILTQKEWGQQNLSEEQFKEKIHKKILKIKANYNNPNYCKLILIDENDKLSTLIGFISIFEHDGDERLDLSPWYATMYVKKEFRGMNYSKLLHNAILKVAKDRGFSRLYLKTDLNNYYEKFGAIFIETLNNGEKLYYFNL